MLDKFGKNKNPFKVPENYFENLNAQIMDKLPEKDTPTTAKRIPMWKKVFSVAAVAAIFCGVILNWNKVSELIPQTGEVAGGEVLPEKTAINQDGLASLSEDDFYLYVQDQVTASDMKELLSTDY